MSNTIALIHATLAAIEPVRQALSTGLPQVQVLNFLDEGLLKRLNEAGSITPDILRRLETMVANAQQSGAQLALWTCSAFSSAVPAIRSRVQIPVFAIDELMIAEAVRQGQRIGVVTTVAGALASTPQLIRAVAEREGREVSVQSVLVEGAFQALLGGQADRHDKLVAVAARALAESSDVIVLAQASMARVADVLADLRVPVLTSPTLAVRKVKEVLGL